MFQLRLSKKPQPLLRKCLRLRSSSSFKTFKDKIWAPSIPKTSFPLSSSHMVTARKAITVRIRWRLKRKWLPWEASKPIGTSRNEITLTTLQLIIARSPDLSRRVVSPSKHSERELDLRIVARSSSLPRSFSTSVRASIGNWPVFRCITILRAR